MRKNKSGVVTDILNNAITMCLTNIFIFFFNVPNCFFCILFSTCFIFSPLVFIISVLSFQLHCSIDNPSKQLHLTSIRTNFDQFSATVFSRAFKMLLFPLLSFYLAYSILNSPQCLLIFIIRHT